MVKLLSMKQIDSGIGWKRLPNRFVEATGEERVRE
jgi:hypothetical protein